LHLGFYRYHSVIIVYILLNKILIFTKKLTMGYSVKIQKVERGTTKSYYINFPAALAESAELEKGEEMEWILEDKNTFVLKRVKNEPPRKSKAVK
jgi:hypothetical protein